MNILRIFYLFKRQRLLKNVDLFLKTQEHLNSRESVTLRYCHEVSKDF
jgi:hypothetical protein